MKNCFKNRVLGTSLVITLLILMCSSQYILAQKSLDTSNVKFKIVCNDTVSVNTKVHIEFVLEYEDQFNPNLLELKIPNIESDCAKLLYVGNRGISTSLNMINGKKTIKHKVKWDAIISTVKEGCFLTPDPILLCKNDTLDISPKAKTIVVKEDTKFSHVEKLRNDTVIKIPDNAIIRLVTVLDKGTINIGDSVFMRINLQSDQSFSEVRLDTPIEIDDCYYENIEIIAGEPVQLTVDGVECFEWKVFEDLLIPLKSGVIRIPEIKLKGNCRVRKEISDPFWGSLPQFYDVPFQTQSKEIKLKVK